MSPIIVSSSNHAILVYIVTNVFHCNTHRKGLKTGQGKEREREREREREQKRRAMNTMMADWTMLLTLLNYVCEQKKKGLLNQRERSTARRCRTISVDLNFRLKEKEREKRVG